MQKQNQNRRNGSEVYKSHWFWAYYQVGEGKVPTTQMMEHIGNNVLLELLKSGLLYDVEIRLIENYFAKAGGESCRQDRVNRTTFIYLMRDERTGYTKIGMSHNVEYREKTLQSDNPMVCLLNYWPGTRNDEKLLHDRYSDRRVRGEWFDLTETDIEDLKNQFVHDYLLD